MGHGRCEVFIVANTESGEQIGAASVSLENSIITRTTRVAVWFNGPELDKLIALLQDAKAQVGVANAQVVERRNAVS